MNSYIEAFERIHKWDTLETIQAKKAIDEVFEEEKGQVHAHSDSYGFGSMPGNFTSMGSFAYDGEKVPGEIGTVKNYLISYQRLSSRGWQSFLESDIAQAIIRKYIQWVIGEGLKVRAEPIMEAIKNTEFNREMFVKQVEVRFKLWGKSKRSTQDGLMSFNRLCSEIKKHSITGGDCLVYLRTDKDGNVTVQLIDGQRISTPLTGSEEQRIDREAGRKIKYGIVFGEHDEHVAFYVRNSALGHTRIPARDENGMTVAFMDFGLRYRIGNCRGLPLHTAILQTIAQLDRYKEAAVGSAEERSKVVFAVEHEIGGTGENIYNRNVKEALRQGLNRKLGEERQYWDDNYGDLIAKTTNKQVPNLPPGAKLKATDSENELNFEPFMNANLTILCATLGMPVEVALSKYDSNFSASRAALKDWEHTLNVSREEFTQSVYVPVYQFWLTVQVMANKIQAQPLVEAVEKSNIELFEAVTNARFLGMKVPHIDPLVEVKAERAKLGDAGKNIPLTTPSQATEALGTGEYTEVSGRYDEEADDYLVDEKGTEIQEEEIEGEEGK